MRHAKSSWNDSSLRDFERPLNSRGKRDAPRMGQFLKEQGLIPGQIFSSPAARAKATILHVVKELGVREKQINWTEDLYFNGGNAYLDAIFSADESTNIVMTVGHNPMTEQVVSVLNGSASLLTMPTAAIACFQSSAGNWGLVSPENCRLQWLQVPKEL